MSTKPAPERSCIDVAMATDEAYAPHAAVVLRSLGGAHGQRPLRVNLIGADDLPAVIRERLRAVAEGAGLQFREVPVPGGWSRQLRAHPVYGFHAWLRLLLPELLPEHNRVLYLDSDVVVAGPLGPLWDVELNGKLLAAVVNPLYPHQSDAGLRRLGLGGQREYFNSGVLLMDLAAMRGGNWTQQLLDYAKNHEADIRFPDQDTLNAVLRGRWLAISPRYNAQAALYDLSWRELPFPRTETQDAVRHPVIVHFTGMHKPWLDACRHPWRHLYWKHLRETPWRNQRPLYPRWWNAILRHLPYRAYRWIWPYLPQNEIKRAPVLDR